MPLAPGPQVEYVDLPDMPETFVDSIRMVRFDGVTMRAELCVTRIGEREPFIIKRYPACRLVLTPEAAVELARQLQKIVAAMEQRGKLKREKPLPSQDVLQNPFGVGQKPQE
jgi:hypothetical protein